MARTTTACQFEDLSQAGHKADWRTLESIFKQLALVLRQIGAVKYIRSTPRVEAPIQFWNIKIRIWAVWIRFVAYSLKRQEFGERSLEKSVSCERCS